MSGHPGVPPDAAPPSSSRAAPRRARGIVVLKFGSSVLREDHGLWPAVHEIYREVRRGRRVVAVVSATGRTTDELLARARAVAPAPAPECLGPLLASGERAAAALLGLALDAAGVPAVVLDPADIGLRLTGDRLDAEPSSLDVAALRAALRRRAVAVLPGFFGVHEGGGTALLGRGGSDLTALFVAQQLGARCRLLKDVDGIYDADPAREDSRRYRALRFEDAARLGARVVQAKALALARFHALKFTVAAPGAGPEGGTRVGSAITEAVPRRAPPPPLRVVLLGFGTVAAAVYRQLGALPDSFHVVRVAVRNPARHAGHGVPPELLTSAAEQAALEPADVVVELLGGLEPATRIIRGALEAGRHVVTANKAVIADCGPPLARLARDRDVRLLYSASVAGAVPAIEHLRRVARRGRIERMDGILNGTSNFVLDRVAGGATLGAALAEARRLGFAEADATLDLDGTDAAQKLEILARAAFGTSPGWQAIPRSGVTDSTERRARDAAAAGRVVRLVASAWRAVRGVHATVQLRELRPSHPLAAVHNEENGLVIRTTSAGRRERTLLRGRGAGPQPTAVAVLADLLDLRRERAGRERDEVMEVTR